MHLSACSDSSDRLRRSAIAVVCLLALVAGLARPLPVAAQPVEQDGAVVEARTRLAAERERVATIARELDAAAAAYEQAEGHLLRLGAETDGHTDAVGAAQAQRGGAEEAFARSVVASYTQRGPETAMAGAVAYARDAGTALHRAALVEQVSARERARADASATQVTRLAVDARQHEVVRVGVAGAVAEVAEEAAALGEQLERARAERERAAGELSSAERAAQARLEEERRAEAARAEAARAETARVEAARREAERAGAARAATAAAPPPVAGGAAAGSRPVPVGGKVCPIGAPNGFIDSWGFPRSGGRSHQGVDMFAAYGMPLYAVADGTITRVYNNRLGGLSIDLVDAAGDRYYYAHLSAASVSSGQRVQAGEVIGENGNSGNARNTPPHLHWQYHPGGGAAVNPYPLAAALCRDHRQR